MAYYSIGFAFSFGSSATNHFIGTEYAPLSLVSLTHSLSFFFLDGLELCSYSFFLFEFVFAAATASIVNGSMAERTSVFGYVSYSAFVTALVYPVVVYWCWDAEGWLFRGDSNGHFFTVSCIAESACASSILWNIADYLCPSLSHSS